MANFSKTEIVLRGGYAKRHSLHHQTPLSTEVKLVMTSSFNGLPSVDEPSNTSIEINRDLFPTTFSITADTISAVVGEDAVAVGLMSHQDVPRRDEERSKPSSDVQEERINSWIHDIVSHEALSSTWDSSTALSESDADDEKETDDRRMKADGVATTNRLKKLMNQDSAGNPYQPKRMSAKGRYTPIPHNDPTLSKPSPDVIARKLSLHNAQTPEGRTTGSGKQQSLLDMVKRRRSSLPASADSYVQLMGARSKSRAGKVPSALNITTAVSGTEIKDSSSTSESPKATVAPPLLQKVAADEGGLNFRMVTKLGMMSKKIVKNTNAIEKFVTDSTHMQYIKDTAEMFKITIPVPIQISLYVKVLPILQETCKTYNHELGPRHQLTKQAFDKKELFSNHLENIKKTMG